MKWNKNIHIGLKCVKIRVKYNNRVKEAHYLTAII